MLLSGSDEAVGIDRDDIRMHNAEVIGNFSCSTHRRLLDSKIRVLLYQRCMASAICKQLKKKGDIDLSSRVFGKMTRTQPIDESLNLELAVDGCMWPRPLERSSTGEVDRLKRRHEAIPERPRRFEALITNMETQGLGLP
jgi:hypothetical protein